jgi:Lon protease-like protein
MRRAGTRFDLAVFPLHDSVLFPGTSLPLPILEERHKQMLADVRARDWPLAVTLVVSDKPSAAGEVRLSSICGAGQVEQIEDAIVVHGRQRVRLLSVTQQHPYLIMEAEALPSGDGDDSILKKRFEEFRSLVQTWAFLHPKIPDELSLLWDEFDSLGELTDFFVFHFVERPEEKQAYLSCNDPVKRAGMLAKYLEMDLIRQNKRLKRDLRSSLLH